MLERCIFLWSLTHIQNDTDTLTLNHQMKNNEEKLPAYSTSSPDL